MKVVRSDSTTNQTSPDGKLRLVILDDSALIEQARARGYLSISIGQENLEFQRTAECRRKCQPCIVLKKYGRWYSIGAHLFGEVLTDAARNRIYGVLIAASLPGGLVRVSNRNIFATRLPFALGVRIVEWLAAVAFANREGKAGREHVRWESRIRPDGSVRVLHRGTDKKAAGRGSVTGTLGNSSRVQSKQDRPARIKAA
jgi:hypothetical protein